MQEIVHIVPMGWEHDRVIAPAREANAHRAHLLVRRDHPLTEHFLDVVTESLEETGIAWNVVDLRSEAEFESTLMHVGRLVRQEADQSNLIHVNMSASGKIAAAAASFAAMFHHEKVTGVYYAEPEDYLGASEEWDKEAFKAHGLTLGYEGVSELPVFQLQKPPRSCLLALVAIYRDGSCTLRDLHEYLIEEEVQPFVGTTLHDTPSTREERKENDRVKAQLRRQIVSKLLDWQLVEKSHRGIGGKVHLTLTQDGRYYALASGRIDQLRTTDKSDA